MTFEEDERASSQPAAPTPPAVAQRPASTPPSPQSTPAPTSSLGEGPSQPPAPTPTAPASLSLSLADRAAAIREHVDALADVSPRDLDGAGALELFDRVFELSDRLQAIATRALPVVESDVPWNVNGARTFPTWLARRAHLTYAKAKRMTRLAHALRDELPLTAAAVVTGGEGRVSVEQAEILTTAAATSDVRRAVLADPHAPVGERFLLDQAAQVSADMLRMLARRWAAAADPEADERGYKDATEREFFDVSATTGGCHLSGFLTTEHGQGLLVALQAVQGVPAAGDDRTASQRRAGALSDLARLTLDQGLTGKHASVRPHISVLVDYPTLIAMTTRAGVTHLLDPSLHPTDCDQVDPALLFPPPAPGGLHEQGLLNRTVPVAAEVLRPAVFEDGQLVSRAVLDRLLCDAEISRFMFSPDSQLINIGRSKRTFTGQLRRAIIARDKHCQYPGCTAPPRMCECHHSIQWFRDHGDTDATTGVLLCWHHHDHTHDHGIEITWTPHGWQFTDRHGVVIRR
ncbi:DUF222 domain-containing protein [Pengzhenrongella phosphoraccumulans]|uniref:HNH endonuclease signature motif containing protein n=1 Tax=Pengzhenrongella phosphoraccumulans TaxID=3114394 RepID=UPI00388D8EDB